MSYNLDQEQVEKYSKGGTSDLYEWVPGTYVLPKAEAPPTDPVALADWSPVVTVQAHAAFRRRTVRFRYVKQSTPPKLPKPVSVGAFTFVGGMMTVPAPTPNINGKFEWEATGQLTFVSTVHNTASDGYILSSPPYVYNSQFHWSGGSPAGAPLDVKQAGMGPKVGWFFGETINFNDPYYKYDEPSYLPGTFFTSDVIDGSDSYPSFQ